LYASAISRLIELTDSQGELNSIDFYIEDQPSDVFNLAGKELTPISAEKFLLYCHLRRLLNWQSLSSFVEIGPGCGQLNEIWGKAQPQCKQFLIDIPPQLYVTQQFMTAIFGDSVMPYELSRATSDFTRTPQRIYPISPWTAEKALMPEIDLFLSQVFEEMAERTVRKYLELATQWKSKYIFITTVLKKQGVPVFSPKQYQDALKDYKLVVFEKAQPDSLPISSGDTNPGYCLLFQRN
jgi:hypothetical protein